MAKVLAPPVVGPVSACSTTVRVDGLIPGTRLVLYCAPDVDPSVATSLVVGLPATVPSMDVPVPTATLAAHVGERVYAYMDPGTNPDSSEVTPEGLAPVIGETPKVLNPPTFDSAIVPCGKSLRIGGLQPGATVVVTVGSMTASTEEFGGVADVSLPGIFPMSGVVSATEVVCGLAASNTTSAFAALPAYLPSPSIDPIYECQTAVGLDGLVPGSTVSITVQPANVIYYVDVNFPKGSVIDLAPIDAGSTVIVEAAMPACRLSATAATTVIGGPPPPPLLVGPVCVDAYFILVSNCCPNAYLEFYGWDDQGFPPTLLFKASVTSSTYQVPLAWGEFEKPFGGFSKIFVTQRLGLDPGCPASARSNILEVSDGPPGGLQAPVVVEPTYACGLRVRVVNAPHNAWLQILKFLSDPTLPAQVVAETQVVNAKFQEVDIPGGGLLLGAKYFPRYIVCGADVQDGPTFVPKSVANANLDLVLKKGVYDDCEAVQLAPVIPGCQIQMWAIVPPSSTMVPIGQPIVPTINEIWVPIPWRATQIQLQASICGMKGKPVTAGVNTAVGTVTGASEVICALTGGQTDLVPCDEGFVTGAVGPNRPPASRSLVYFGDAWTYDANTEISAGLDPKNPDAAVAAQYTNAGNGWKPVFAIADYDENGCPILVPAGAPNATYRRYATVGDWTAGTNPTSESQFVVQTFDPSFLSDLAAVGSGNPYIEDTEGGPALDYNGVVYLFFIHSVRDSCASAKLVSGTNPVCDDHGGRSVLLSAADPGGTFGPHPDSLTYEIDRWSNNPRGPTGDPTKGTGPVPNTPGFHFLWVSSVLINNADYFPTVPFKIGDGLFVWGTGMAHQSHVYLAYVPLQGSDVLPNVAFWWFWDGTKFVSEDGSQAQPIITATGQMFNTTGRGAGMLTRGFGEISVAWLPSLNRWVVFAADGNGPIAYAAPSPWGDKFGNWDPISGLLVDVPDAGTQDGATVPGSNFGDPHSVLPKVKFNYTAKTTHSGNRTLGFGPYGNMMIPASVAFDSDSGESEVTIIASYYDQGVPGDEAPTPFYYGTFAVRIRLRGA